MHARWLWFWMLLLSFCLASVVSADEVLKAKVFKADKGKLAFEHEGKKRALSFGIGLKYYDKEGKELDPLQGAGIFAQGNIVNLTTVKDDTSPDRKQGRPS